MFYSLLLYHEVVCISMFSLKKSRSKIIYQILSFINIILLWHHMGFLHYLWIDSIWSILESRRGTWDWVEIDHKDTPLNTVANWGEDPNHWSVKSCQENRWQPGTSEPWEGALINICSLFYLTYRTWKSARTFLKWSPKMQDVQLCLETHIWLIGTNIKSFSKRLTPLVHVFTRLCRRSWMLQNSAVLLHIRFMYFLQDYILYIRQICSSWKPSMVFLSEALKEERAEHMVLGGILHFLLLKDQIPGQKNKMEVITVPMDWSR